MNRLVPAVLTAILVLSTLACAAAPPREEPAPDTTEGTEPADRAEPRPEGMLSPPPPEPTTAMRVRGTLDWDNISVRMVGREVEKGLQIDVTTLDEEALELIADDIRPFFDDVMRRIPEAVPPGALEDLTPFLVGYTAFEKEISFDPSRLRIVSEGSTFYPRYIVPISPSFDRRLINLYETLYGVYLFDASIDLYATLEFRYGELSTGDSWRRVIQNVQRAKARVEGTD